MDQLTVSNRHEEQRINKGNGILVVGLGCSLT